jgi:hypothetical protein
MLREYRTWSLGAWWSPREQWPLCPDRIHRVPLSASQFCRDFRKKR